MGEMQYQGLRKYANPQKQHEWVKSIIILVRNYSIFNVPEGIQGLYGESHVFNERLDEASDGYKAREEFRVFLEGLGLQAATERKYGLTAGRWAAYLDAAFTVSDGCMGCGLCRRICPVRSIQLENGKPVWLHHYERCVTCISWCPAGAIGHGD